MKATTLNNNITKPLTESDIVESTKYMVEVFKKPRINPALEVMVGGVKQKDKEKANHYFKKYFNKLGFEGELKGNIDSLVITYNPKYKKWNPLDPFKGRNPKYIVMGIDKGALELGFKKPELNYFGRFSY